MSQEDYQISNNIGGSRYKVMMLNPMTAADMLADLGKIFSPVLGTATTVLAGKEVSINNLLKEQLSAEVSKEIGGSVQQFFANFPKDKQREFMESLSKVTFVMTDDGKEILLSSIMNVHFRGKMKSMFTWFFFALKAQFSDFFSSLSDVTSLLEPDKTS